MERTSMGLLEEFSYGIQVCDINEEYVELQLLAGKWNYKWGLS